MAKRRFGIIARRTALLMLAAMVVALAPQAQAAWPEKPIKFVLPFGVGGVADVTARILADQLSQKLNQRVVVENMPGPGGIAAARAVITAPPDGYTMAWVTNAAAISVATFQSLPFDPTKDFAMVSMAGTFDLVFVVNSQSDYKSLGDFIKAAKASPGTMNVGTIAAGSTQNLGGELFKSMADINVQIVPYKNSPDIVVALLRNDVQLMIDFPPAVAGQVADNKLRILATSSPQPSPLLAGVPTADQAGVKGYEVISWNGVGVPKDTPKEIIEMMNKAMREVLAMPDVQEQLAKVGVVAKGSTPAELIARLTSDIKKWNDVVDKTGIPRK
jgi:tripartite-type tricarboxylate transporter receptor subunit TctC